MSYARALLAKDTSEEKAKLETQAKKKGLLQSLGSTLGSVAAMAFLGPGAGALMTGLTSAAGSAIGGAIGGNQQKISGGKFYQEDREGIKTELKTSNITNALTTGVTAGASQKLDLAKAKAAGTTTGVTADASKTLDLAKAKAAGTPLAGKGMDIGNSWAKQVGKPAVGKVLKGAYSPFKATSSLLGNWLRGES